MSKVLQAFAFGNLKLQYDGLVVADFPTRHAEELLGFLLINQRVAHPREKLISLLWPDTELAKGRGRFSTALWQLRRLFGEMGVCSESYIQASRKSVCFDPEQHLQFDVTQFKQRLAQAELTLDVVEREELLSSAVELSVGDLMDGIYSDWCLIERERLARLRLRAQGQLMASYVSRHAYQRAVEIGQMILSEDPLREEVHRALMHCYWQMGHRTQAIQQFHLCAVELMNELQVSPMPETISLYRQITEERLVIVRSNTETETYPRAVQAALSEYLRAGEKLNKLLDSLH
jgi:DNA-binding SARP family transcriptional activator